MKETTNYKRSVNFLSKAFDYINNDFFNNELPTPVITIQSSPKSYGHFVADSKCWTIDNADGTTKGAYEINISAGTLNRPIENVISTLIHECVHLYCCIHGLKDTSNGGAYHNKIFKTEAERHGLAISHGSTIGINHIGYSVTEPTEAVINFCVKYGLEDMKMHRNEHNLVAFVGGTKSGTNPISTTGKAGHSIKWMCPCCHTSVRSTKPNVNIICGNCAVQFVQV